MNRIPTLDGWRGIAILLVLFEHTEAALTGGYARRWFQIGQHGVTIFFVLSGYLITSKLLEGPIDLRRFYIRRFFRLMPVAWAYLAALLLFDCLVHVPFTSTQEIFACLFFYRNFITTGHGGAMAGHFWSLSMEEQFYLLWPCLLLIVGSRRAAWIAALGALSCAGYRLAHWDFYSQRWLAFHTEVRADALLTGCLLALLIGRPEIRSIATRWSRRLTLPAVSVLLFCLVQFQWLPPLSECLAICCLIAASVLHPVSIPARLLSFPALTWLGRVSYSIYVWQQIFLAHYPVFSFRIIMMCLLPLFGLGSYYLIERPCTRLGHRLTDARRTSLSSQLTGSGRHEPAEPAQLAEV
jgi:peptidoglycan/LPS O-acetylase OafA/YrhL